MMASRRFAVRALATAALLTVTAVAGAKNGLPGAQVFRYPSELTLAQLEIVLQSSSSPTTVIFERSSRREPHVIPSQLFIFDRANLTLCGATGRPSDVVIELQVTAPASETAGAGIILSQASDVTFRGLTLTTGGDADQALRLQAVAGNSFASFVEGVTIDRCVIEARRPVVATAEVRDLTVSRSTLEVQADDASALVWGDGPGLYVYRTKFRASAGTAALHGIHVLGAAVDLSDGERAARIVLTHNHVRGDFASGFQLLDVREVRVRHNRIQFTGGAVRAASPATGNITAFRTGIFVQREAASAVPDDFELIANRVRGAGYGIAVWNADSGVIARNDLRRCGSSDVDTKFGTNGGGLHMISLSPNCRIRIEKNDFRNLRSPDTVVVGSSVVDVPAITVAPEAFAGNCFTEGDGNNKVSRGRLLFAGADQ